MCLGYTCRRGHHEDGRVSPGKYQKKELADAHQALTDRDVGLSRSDDPCLHDLLSCIAGHSIRIAEAVKIFAMMQELPLCCSQDHRPMADGLQGLTDGCLKSMRSLGQKASGPLTRTSADIHGSTRRVPRQGVQLKRRSLTCAHELC